MSEQKFCYEYPRPAVVADTIVLAFFNGKQHLLLIKRAKDPYGNYWAFPGGFLDGDETIEECAMRELQEETGLKVSQVEQLITLSAPDRDPRGRVISVVCICRIADQDMELDAGDDASDAQWFALDELPQLAFDHGSVIPLIENWLKKESR